ncbi:response regulator [Paenibacillus nasutitermitis]|uniref:Response regulator n=1 Tax=Paenibacillus nasutitermitis TaxID=1652958 RepID=A0A916YLW2_9BACL|nr:response regulator [Paenibacillus nasutitermitis]GGD50949.1 hypothetical protein GCM10010911_05590 [Paenibacillus nasutitermitis]
MVKALVVDDEYYIREGIVTSIPWGELGIDTVGEAEEGLEAWNKFQSLRPDIVLLDINLPKLSGIEVARRIRNVDQEAQILFLTGYDDYSYLKEAITLQAVDYLLKPIVYDDLLQLFKAAVSKHHEKNKSKQYLSLLKSQIQSLSQAPQDIILLDLLQSRTRADEIVSQIPFLQAHTREHIYYVISMEIDLYEQLSSERSQQDKATYMYAYQKLAQEAADQINLSDCRIISDFPGRLIAVISYGVSRHMRTYFDEQIIELAQHFQRVFRDYLKTTITAGVSSLVNGYDRLPEAYHQSLHALVQKSAVGSGKILFAPYMETRIHHHIDIMPLELSMLSRMSEGNLTLAQSSYRRWTTKIYASGASSIKGYAKNLVMPMMRMIHEFHLEGDAIDVQPLLTGLVANRSNEEIEGLLLGYITSITTEIAQTKKIPVSKMISKAKTWISEHLDEELRLTQLAELLHISPNHFSVLFKQATGVTFTEYVLTAKFDKAKELLANTDMKISDIASEVGYIDSNYFSIAFKKHEGVTPSVYKKMNVVTDP